MSGGKIARAIALAVIGPPGSNKGGRKQHPLKCSGSVRRLHRASFASFAAGTRGGTFEGTSPQEASLRRHSMW